MSVAAAALACGVTERTIRGRIERGNLRVTKRAGRVYIATADLIASDLLPVGESERERAGYTPDGQENRAASDIPSSLVELLKANQIELLELTEKAARASVLLETAEANARSAEERSRAEKENAERLESEVHELRARITELEAGVSINMTSDSEAPSRSWWSRMIGGTQ